MVKSFESTPRKFDSFQLNNRSGKANGNQCNCLNKEKWIKGRIYWFFLNDSFLNYVKLKLVHVKTTQPSLYCRDIIEAPKMIGWSVSGGNWTFVFTMKRLQIVGLWPDCWDLIVALADSSIYNSILYNHFCLDTTIYVYHLEGR